jgi:hypothetical protein
VQGASSSVIDHAPNPNVSSSHMNTYQYFNFDIEGIPQTLVSQTTGGKQKKDLMGSRGSMPGVVLPNNNLLPGGLGNSQPVTNGGTSGAEDMNMDSSMHQSFINLIYPSKSKKLMSGEVVSAGGKDQTSMSGNVNHSSTASIPNAAN